MHIYIYALLGFCGSQALDSQALHPEATRSITPTSTLKPNKVNTVIKACANCGDLQSAELWFGRRPYFAYLWLVGNGRMVVIVVIIVPHSSIPY